MHPCIGSTANIPRGISDRVLRSIQHLPIKTRTIMAAGRELNSALPPAPAGAFAGTWDAVASECGLPSHVRKILREKLRFPQATPVQLAAIPLCLGKHRDVAAEAATGSGKTLAFTIPLVSLLIRRALKGVNWVEKSETKGRFGGYSVHFGLKKYDVAAVVIAPVRELAEQTADVVGQFMGNVEFSRPELNEALGGDNIGGRDGNAGANVDEDEKAVLPLTSMLLIGGRPLADDIAQFQRTGAHVLIGTPGRVLAFLEAFESGSASSAGMSSDSAEDTSPRLRALEYLVLDEADRLLQMGFRKTLDAILNRLPKQRRTGLFSATQTREVDELIRAGLRNPARVSVAVQRKSAQNIAPANGGDSGAGGGRDITKPQLHTAPTTATPNELTNLYEIVPEDEKIDRLVHLLENCGNRKIVVFFLTCASVDYFYRVLSALPQLRSTPLFSLHGRAPHEKRTEAYRKFVGAPRGVLLTTDVASRGLDIPNVQLIVQLDAPQDPATFIHRVGRTARLGRSGSALVFLAPHEDNFVDFMNLKRVPLVPTSRCTACGTLHTERADPALDNEDDDSGMLLPHAVPSMVEPIRALLRKDRALVDYSVAAYCSFIRGYQAHHCSYIFQLSKLEMGKLGMAFGLLELPKMPELRKKYGTAEQKFAEARREAENARRRKGNRRVPHAEQVQLDLVVPGFTPDPLVTDIERIPYKDKQRERARRRKTKETAIHTSAAPAATPPVREREAQSESGKPGKSLSKRPTADRSDDDDVDDDWEEMLREERLAKKLKRRRITQEEFDAAVGNAV